MINSNIENKIADLWMDSFPELGLCNKRKFYKVIGPLVVGIELYDIRSSKFYRPQFAIYPLWNSSETKWIENPQLAYDFFDHRGLQYKISYDKHPDNFKDIVEQIRSQIILPLHGTIFFTELEAGIEHYLNSKAAILGGVFSRFSAYRLLFNCSVFLDNKKLRDRTIEKIKIECKSWNQDLIKNTIGSIDHWINELESNTSNSVLFFENVSTNLKSKKLCRLPRSDIRP